MENTKGIPKTHCDNKEASRHTPSGMIGLMIAAIFLCELFIMFVLHIWPVTTLWLDLLIDSTALIIMLIPFLYIFCFRPMNRTICSMRKAESELKEYQNNLERLVKERTLQLENAMTIAEIANQAKCDFFANISHELRTPLNAILGFSDFMLHNDKNLSATQREYLNDINNSGRQLHTMVTKILDMSEIVSGNNHMVYGEVSVKDLINESIAFTREEIREKGLNLSVNIEQNIGTITADNDKLMQVMANLLSNAVKFTPENGSITVTAKKSVKKALVPSEGDVPEYLEISVRDTGPGIKAEDMHKVFSPFQQMGSVYTKEHSGAGISLAVCKYFIEAHGGAISVESEWGQGCNFIISLPMRKE